MRRLLTIIPMTVFLTIFFYAPFAILAYQSFQTGKGLGLENYVAILRDPAYALVIAKSLLLAAETTALSLLLALPAALYTGILAGPGERRLILGLFIVPFWVDILLRALALRSILYMLGLREGYLAMLIGMVYDYLPLMFLPLYASTAKIGPSTINAARTLGAGWRDTLLRVILPLLAPGILAGSVLVFLMSVTEFVIPALLGGVDGFTVGTLIYYTFLSGGLWGVGAALTVVVVVALAVSTILLGGRVEVTE